ncbi:MAG: bifunctional riboflavin kinase/FAD synthetase [Oscillospiraceae bacterium]|nr:bifunctional riboflavin kinase/FAD synthetase [Oscillospiraceae bacterium]
MTKNPTSVALGYFDGVHLGHAAVIRAAATREYEPAVFTFKSRSPLPKLVALSNSGGNNLNIISAGQKRKMLLNLGVKHIHSYEFHSIKGLSPEDFVLEILIKALNAKVVSCGYDFHFGEGGKAGADDLSRICKNHGLNTIVVPPVKIDGVTVSSTLIREFISAGDIKTANKFLGYPISYNLKVVGGNMLGRTIGFPTINQNMPEDCVIPRLGVYKSCVFLKGKTFDGITNIGFKPTAGEYKKITAETHIINFNEDLYGRIIKFCLLDFIREEKKFASFEELKEQIHLDLKHL